MKKFSKSLIMLTLSLSLTIPFLGGLSIDLSKNTQSQTALASTMSEENLNRYVIEPPPLA